MMVCEKCGAQLDEDCVFCPKCGNKINAKKKAYTGKIIGGILLLVILGSGIFLYVSGQYRNIFPRADNVSEEAAANLAETPDGRGNAEEGIAAEPEKAQQTEETADKAPESAAETMAEPEAEKEPGEIEKYLDALVLEPVEMTMGETFQVELEKEIPGAVWTSSDETIVRSSDGKLKAAAPGKAVVTLSAEGKECSFDVTVNAFPDMTVAVEHSVTLELNDAFSEVQWESSAPEIIEVNEGVVSALAAGASTLTASVDGKEYSFEVVGTTPEITTTSVRKIIGNTEQVSVLGTNGKAEWKSDNTAIATVSDTGLITAEPTGAGQNTVVHAYIDGMEFKIDVAVEPIPQLSSTYKIYGYQNTAQYKNATIALCTNANEVMKIKYEKTANEWDEELYLTTEVQEVLNVADADYSDGSTYPVYRAYKKGKYAVDDKIRTDIYLVGTSQTAEVLVQRLGYCQGEFYSPDSVVTYEPCDGYGIIHVYCDEVYSGGMGGQIIVTVMVDGYQYQFAISKMGDGHFDYAYRDRIPENYMIEECSVDEIVTMQNSNYSAVASNFKTYNSNNDWMERIGTKFVEAVEDEAISMAAGALLKFIF